MMHPDLRTLYNLQLADTHLKISNRQLENLDHGAAQQKGLADIRKAAVAMAAEKAAAEKALREAESGLSQTEERIRRIERRIQHGDIHNEHEMESNEKELISLRDRRASLEDEALRLMEVIESFPPRANDLRAREHALVVELKANQEKAAAETARLQADIEGVTRRRADLAGNLSPQMLARYEHMRGHSSGTAISRIVNGTCDTCRVAVAPNLVKTILETGELVPCQGCGRYLFTDSDSAITV